MDFRLDWPKGFRNIGIRLEMIRKSLYICRPYRGVEQYASAALSTGSARRPPRLDILK
ncbi:MAG: hypothetical protein R2819_10205 [Allomuricauda sp.]